MRKYLVPTLIACAAVALVARTADAAAPATAPASKPAGAYAAQAREVTAHLQKTFYDPKRGFYNRAPDGQKPDDVWRQAAAFSALVAAARHDPATYRPVMARTFKGLDAFWDAKVAIPGYEPLPTRGNGNDKYYDDNAWLVITFLEAYQLTGEKQYLDRGRATAKFVASGGDDQLGGGVWWHQSHKDGSKNACACGPAAVGYLYMARLGDKAEADAWVKDAERTVDWTIAKLQDRDGLFDDRIIVATGEVKRGKLTYNSALMLRACLGLYRKTGKAEHLEQAKRIGRAADWFTDKKTGVFRDPLKWSHFMLEADLELYRATGEAYLMERAKRNADAWYAAWKKEPPTDMMSNACLARSLWLLADVETEVGRKFWREADAGRK